jgi:hypothetical protein
LGRGRYDGAVYRLRLVAVDSYTESLQ